MKVLLVFLSALVVSQQATLQEVRISNGDAVEPFSIPYQVFVWIFPPLGNVDRYACGGVLLTPNYVLTSAQCVSRMNRATVYAGVNNPFDYREDGGQIRNIFRKDGIIHEGFNAATLENNIGLISVSALQLNDHVTLAQLPAASDANRDLTGQQGRLSGWVYGQYFRPEVLRAINNTVISNDECNKSFGNIRDYEICLSGSNQRRACAGDEGGPLVIGNTVQGIISFRNVACNSNNPTVITKIAPFLGWIQANSDWKP